MKKVKLFYFILIVILILLVVINVITGSVKVSTSELFNILFSHNTTDTVGKIIWEIRLPRIMSAIFLGGALALAGYLLQTFFSNPIAGPFVLGISSGAKLIVAILMVSALSHGFIMKSWMMVLAAFIGSMFATGIVLAVSTKVRSMSILIVCGVMIGYICSAATELIVAFADDSNIVNLHNWSMGTFSSSKWSDAGLFVPVIVVAAIFAFFLSKPISAYSFGADYAESLGINLKLFRTGLILVSSILSATVTAFAGPISFVGIAIPHVVRSLFKTEKPTVIIPASFLGGAIFCLFSDLLARSLFAPTELSISTMTAIFGAPIVISMLLKRRM